MIKVKKKGTPLLDGLYVVHRGFYQLRLKGTQECMAAVGSVEDLVRCTKVLIDTYGTVEYLTRLLNESEDYRPVAGKEFVRRQYEEELALDSSLYREWYQAMTCESKEKPQTPPKKIFIKRVKIR